ncbi:transglycosylase domain-containing protein [uncultured Anaerotruncus sp.]|uniref:transglycosylase domain-containing protein n=1 Tax=uncultured Anaerotruncus sp. TaxID=905011 RepID=UPI002585F74F|nr:transglycosylase domain-containing protein [uncultured Anaerotruncus sp.]
MGSRKDKKGGGVIRGTLANIGRVIAALIMVGIITGCIIASVLTVYILRYINSDEEIRLSDLNLRYSTILYTEETDPETGEPKVLQQLQTTENRIWVSLDKIPKHMQEAVVAIEDQRFWTHQGVDWKRTFGAFVNMFIPIYPTQAGGSTIDQQLIKNITGDNEVRIERKVQEIFRALNLEKRYSKDQILEAYLNTIYFNNGAYGVQAAANTYFGKDVSELSVAEAASIIGITNAPGAYNPLAHPEANKRRQENILFAMHEQGYLTDKEYEEALNEKLEFKTEFAASRVNPVYSYFTDYVIDQVIDDLMEQYGYTNQVAQQMVTSGGLRIYTTVDERVQDIVTNFYSDVKNFPTVTNEGEYPQSAAAILDPNGKIIALAGGIGEKRGMREFNRATDAYRQCGSSIKPISAYLQAVERDVVTWSTKIDDGPVDLGTHTLVNHYSGYLGPITVDEALQRSTNTVPYKLIQQIGPKTSFDFLTEKLDMYSLVDRKVTDSGIKSDIDVFPMALGGLTDGVSPLEMAGAYQIFANGGYFTRPYAYTRVLDADGNPILERDTTPRRVITPETATIINRLMQRVTTGPHGTGGRAPWNSASFPVAGKTGTTDDDKDQWFIGDTPYYVCAIWMGYDEPERIRYTGVWYPPPEVYRTLMQQVHEGLEPKQFPIWGDVQQAEYCTESGDLAGDSCATTATGWYKTTNMPPVCTYCDAIGAEDLDDRRSSDDDDDDRGRSSSSKSGGLIRRSPSGLRIIDNDD